MTTPVVAPNRLSREKSPYLLQHAANPVDWYPWGEEAFRVAEEEGKPVFLSIGYSTCHWCHVMARESFMDREVASLMNRHYVAVKVDREERPDVDHVYMSVCQMLTGSGGWPLTVIMTPDKKPFFAGTYFPKSSRFGLPGLLHILTTVKDAWSKDPGALTKQADRVYAALQEEIDHRAALAGSEVRMEAIETADRAYRHLRESFDEQHGGFGGAPKFPTPHTILFLLRYWKLTGQKRALDMAEKTMTAIYAGGIYDHIGFGFFRYSTDAAWLVPHFEKMLYDQAMMMMAFTELWLATKKDLYKTVVYEVAAFVEAEMKSDKGAFLSAIDAESEGEEGKFYVFTPEEVISILGPKDGLEYCQAFDITTQGNFHGKSIPNLSGDHTKIQDRKDSFSKSRRKLYAARGRRVRPSVDDKVLTSWNSLAAAAFAKAGRAFSDPALTETASTALHFIEGNLWLDGRLHARYRDAETAHPAYLDDYSFLLQAYLEMRETTQDDAFLTKAIDLAAGMIDLFWDKGAGRFYLTGRGAEELIVRPHDAWDGAIPSGNSVAVASLLRLQHLTDEFAFGEVGLTALDTLRPLMHREPTGLLHLISAALYEESGALDILAIGRRDDPVLRSMLSYVSDLYLPFTQLRFQEVDGAASVVLCQKRACSEPITTVEGLQQALIASGRPLP